MEGMSKFLSRRSKRTAGEKQKNRGHIEEVSQPGVECPVSPSTGLYNIFACEDDRKQDNDEEKKKIKLVAQRLATRGINTIKVPQITYALRSPMTNGDPKEAAELLFLFEDSIDGVLRQYNPRTKLLGAENRCAVTCYLDALLFAMFARLDCFEAMLFESFADSPRKRLATVLRLWVNLLRGGRLISVDITKNLQDALADCGWEEAARLYQQDASEAFTFITGQLELPLLTLKMDIYHTGKEDMLDDHRFINERLLEVAIPEDDPLCAEPIKLEDCLQVYFNNRIEVRRHLDKRATFHTVTPSSAASQGDQEKPDAIHIESVELAANLESMAASTHNKSLFTEQHYEEKPSSEAGCNRSSSFTKKEITIPAWQFFSLIPWYTDNEPANDAQVAAHFATKRPILGICLKRYSISPSGQPVRRDTYIDIPLEIALPHFISDDRMRDEGPLFGNFQLVLQSVVCHRGVSVDSGHYISLVRGQASDVRHGTEQCRADGIDDEPTVPWMRFDDLAPERVTYVDINQTLQEETPYLLFYQVCPIDEDLPHGNPPTYEEANLEPANGDGSILLEKRGPIDIDTSDCEPSRPSLERTETRVLSAGDGLLGCAGVARGRSSFNGIRRNSIAFDAASLVARSPTGPSTPADETKPTFLSSRRGSKVAKKSGNKSRPTSQSGEGRLSITMSLLAGRKSKDKINDSAGVSDNNEKQNGGGDAGNEDYNSRSATNSVNPVVLIEMPTSSHGGPPTKSAASMAFSRGRKEKRARWASSAPLADEQAKGPQRDGDKGKSKRKPPDRECVAM